ncbi:CoF synthetase [Mycolicibacterium chubuense]|uniref:Phenylacetate-coenzyme A ligase n=1 Tax=Mycolicibacterium chubuense TaxID=1800 RepID=A0A0J6WNX7_MYCCU|nr:phenylacetate--CoA ligase family protein [Mycolicibacterium chubuense]KMO84279.1 Phenylacetate-coenzyme A ligase [Mycolicibacterium chubuense]ORA54870.1 CoF synthetase [Mycolicibacterium chubuense]SPY45950.1 coenzyme F390 synthetase [Mycolicibacterium chubuense]
MKTVTYPAALWDTFRAAREGQAAVAARRQRRLDDIAGYARTHSRYYGRLYHDVPERISEIGQLPVTTKADLMAHFDDWVTDMSVTRTEVEAFLADPRSIGRDFLGRYVVCTTSGATGIPAILLHDMSALTVYNVLGYVRSLPAVRLSPRQLWALVRGRFHLAAVMVSGGHYLGNVMMARRLRTMRFRRRTQRLFSALAPIDELVRDLNAFAPVMVAGYPSALETLALERQAGSLTIHPVMVTAAGETLSAAQRRLIGTAFGCPVSNYYGSSEAVGLTFECSLQRLHVNSDWYIVEPVDDHNQPVPAGRLSDGVLVTNLANRIQPVIRYQLGDRVALMSDPCPCGSLFPVIDVVGRTDDVLVFRAPSGGEVRVLPLAIATVAEETPGLARCQLIQRTPSTLTVRMRAIDPDHETAVWGSLSRRLTEYLSALGATTVTVERSDEPPTLHPRSGKFRQVFSEIQDHQP